MCAGSVMVAESRGPLPVVPAALRAVGFRRSRLLRADGVRPYREAGNSRPQRKRSSW